MAVEGKARVPADKPFVEVVLTSLLDRDSRAAEQTKYEEVLMIPGGSEILIVLAVVLLLFGAKRIPELARSLGSGVQQFREGISGENEGGEEEKIEELTVAEEAREASVTERGED